MMGKLVTKVGFILSFSMLITMLLFTGTLSNIAAMPVLSDPRLKVEILSTGLKFPTSMAFVGQNDIVVLEKNEGTVKRIVNGSIMANPLLDVNVSNKNERGMLGIAVQSNQTSNAHGPYVYLYYTESRGDDGEDFEKGQTPLGNRLYRYELVGDHLVHPQIILDLPAQPGPSHNSGKITIGPDKNIYVTVGDLEGITKSQNIQNGSAPDGRGGILRVTSDGTNLNGILGKDSQLSLYYAYGIRNSFGLAFDPLKGNLWDTENGADFGDEINLVKPGFNSGWNRVQGIWKAYKTEKLEIETEPTKSLVDFNGKGRYSSPEFTWKNPVGPTGIVFSNSADLGKQYENDLFVGDFHNGNIYHFDLNGDRTQLNLKGNLSDAVADTKEEQGEVVFGQGFGAITDIKFGPDGYLYILSISTGGIDCYFVKDAPRPCTSYNSELSGTVFKISPAHSD